MKTSYYICNTQTDRNMKLIDFLPMEYQQLIRFSNHFETATRILRTEYNLLTVSDIQRIATSINHPYDYTSNMIRDFYYQKINEITLK